MGQVIPLDAEEVMVGRSSLLHDRRTRGEPAIFLPHHAIARLHARFRRRGDGYVAEDLQSHNGTYVNGVQIREAIVLTDGDRIRLCDFEFVYRASHIVTAEEIAAAVVGHHPPRTPR